MLRLFWNWHAGASNVWLSGRNANYVPTQAATPRAPPRPPATPAPGDPALPRWQHLTPQVQQPMLAVLTRMLQQHLAAATNPREVANESR